MVLEWGRALNWYTEKQRAENEKRTRALRSYLAPSGSFSEERIRSASDLMKGLREEGLYCS